MCFSEKRIFGMSRSSGILSAKSAFRFSIFLCSVKDCLYLLKIAFQAFTHAVFPWFFENSASDQIQELNRVLQERRDSANSDKN